MFQLDEAWDESQRIFGACDEVKLLRWMSDAASLIWNKMDAEGGNGTLDICTCRL